MTSFPILDLVAGLIFIYFLLALINNSCIELYSTFIQLRAKMLEEWIRTTFAETAHAILDNILLSGLTAKGKSTHYMNGKNFAKAVAEQVYTAIQKEPATATTPSPAKPLGVSDIDGAIASTSFPEPVKKLLRNFVMKTHIQQKITDKMNDAEHFEEQIEQWFNGIMERLSGRYKRKTVWYTFFFATITTLALNIDSLQLANFLYNNPEARQKLAGAAYSAAQDTTYINKVNDIQQRAKALAKDTSSSDSVKQLALSLNRVVNEVKKEKTNMETTVATLNMYIPIGWPDKSFDLSIKNHGPCWGVVWFGLKKIGGLLMTILAICLGAPFWFDVLGKVANLRSSLKPEDKKK
ncbi:hypothetical protein WSM22_25430 [Cytophagales bacterium WSM2-2]|nr:hypothetical protein WSM22_25430 [Cytophagales bacterium WSM2-2]